MGFNLGFKGLIAEVRYDSLCTSQIARMSYCTKCVLEVKNHKKWRHHGIFALRREIYLNDNPYWSTLLIEMNDKFYDINHLKPFGYYMYCQFNIQQFYVLPTLCIYVFCVDLRTKSDYLPIQH